MRIDDLNRALQTQDTAKTDAVGSERAKTAGTAASNSDADAASISQLASHALDPALDATSVKTHDARLEALRQVDVLVSATAPAPPPKHTALTAPFVNADDVRSRFFFRRSRILAGGSSSGARWSRAKLCSSSTPRPSPDRASINA